MEKIKTIVKKLEVPFYLGIYALIMAFPNRDEGLMLGLLTVLFVYFLAGDFIKPVMPKRRHILLGFLFMCAQVFAMTAVGTLDTVSYIVSVFGLTLINSFTVALVDEHLKPFEKLKKRLKKLDNRSFILFVAAIAVLCGLAVYSSYKTSIFTLPSSNGVLFGAGSRTMSTNADFTAFPINHELTMAFFGLAYLPFNLIAHAVALPIHWIFPTTDYSIFFAFGTIISQIIILVLCTFFLYDILKNTFSPLVSTAICAVFIGSFSTLISMLTAEKYIFATFCLLLFVKCRKRRDEMRIPLFSVAACSFALNFAALPILLSGKKKKEKAVLWKTAISVLLMLLLSGSLAKPFISVENFALSMPFGDKITHFFRFVYGIFLPNSYVESSGALKITDSNVLETVIGGIIFGVVVLGGITLMKKIPLMKVSFYWVCVSAVLFAILGLGGSNMNLYAICFGWAYIISIACCLKTLYEKKKFVGIVLTACIAGALAIFSLIKIIDIVNFGMENLPLM